MIFTITKNLVKRAGLMMIIMFSVIFSVVVGGNGAHATASTLTINITDSVALDITSISTTGTFATSDTSTNNISVSTNNGTGYTLGIKASVNNSNALINSTDSSKTIPSITTSISEATYASDSTYNNTWGLRPSKLNSAVNTNYIVAPTSSSTLTTLDKTTSANPSTANNYNLAIGTRVNSSTTPGSYSNVFVITATANPIPYTITYNKNTEDTVTNMPANTSSQTYDEAVTISDQVPARDGFNFKGWCTTQVADGGTCSGTTYNPDGGGTDLNWTLDQTVSSNSLTLYAMWAQSITLQDMTFADCPTDTAKSVSDARDGESYKVQVLADGNCWMLDNLRLDLGNSTVLNNTTGDNTNASTTTLNYLKNGGGSTSDRYPTAKINNVPWTSSSQNYYSIPMTISTYKDQTTTSYGEGSGKIGVYYNYCAASAGNYCFGNGTSQGSPSGNATEDICPKGWRMPTGGSSGEYQALYTAYSSDSTNFKNALSTPLSGYFLNGYAGNQGTNGYFLSSTRYNSTSMYYLYVNSSNVNLTDSDNRGRGHSVRCVKTPPPTLYDTVKKAWETEGSRVLTNDTNTSTGIQADITTSNSGVFKYNPSTFGTASDAANTSDIYFYRGILDTTVGSYGSDGDNAAHPNTVVLSSASSKGNLTTSDTCWRIVRTTGSGGVKMIYQGKWTGSTCANATTAAQVTTNTFSVDSSKYYGSAFGYTQNGSYNSSNLSATYSTMFGSNTSYSANSTNSGIKTYIENTWFTNINSYASKLEPSAGYCNDRTLNTGTSWTTPMSDSTTVSKSTSYYAGAYIRNMTATLPPSLTCSRSGADLYTTSSASNGNKQLSKPAALITADEASFAGSGRSDASQGSSYHANSFLRSGSYFWLLSPSRRNSSGYARGFSLHSGGNLSDGSVDGTSGVRPAISLTSGTTAVSGTGTATDPWIVNP